MDRILFLENPREVRWKINSEWPGFKAKLLDSINYFTVWEWLEAHTSWRIGIFDCASSSVVMYFEKQHEHDEFLMQAKLRGWFETIDSKPSLTGPTARELALQFAQKPKLPPLLPTQKVQPKPSVPLHQVDEDDMRDSVGVYNSKDDS